MGVLENTGSANQNQEMFITQLYNALQGIETGGLQGDDRYIRATYRKNPETGEFDTPPPGGSTAYGPLQITSGPGSMMRNIAADKDYFRNEMGLTDTDFEYIDKYIAQGQKFLDYGYTDMIPGMEHYDYGQAGELTSKSDQEAYDRMARKILKYQWEDQASNDPMEFIREWHMGSVSDKEWNDFLSTEKGSKYVNQFLGGMQGAI